MATEKHVNEMLDNLIALDVQTTQAYYEMGQILHAFYEGGLHDVIGYDSHTHMIEEELSFTVSTAHHYRLLYSNLQRLHYNKAESCVLIRKFGMTKLSLVLKGMKSKTGQRAIKNKIEALDSHQINFTVSTKELEECHQALIKNGAEIDKDSGRFKHSSSAFMTMVHERNKKPTLKSVA